MQSVRFSDWFTTVGVDLKVLVTGGCGFVGSHLVNALLGRGFEVRVVDDLSSGRLENVKRWEGNAGFEFVRGDLRDQAVTLVSVDGVDLVFHLAANPDVRLGSFEPRVHFDKNLARAVVGFLNVFDVAV